MRAPDLSANRALLEQLRPFRRRLVAVHVVEQLAVAATATCAVWATALLLAWPAPGRAGLWLALASVAAVAATGCRTLLQPWSFTTTAATVDRALHLDERVTTALTCVEANDAVAPLIVADARKHLQARGLRELRPAWRVDPRLLAGSLAAALVAAVVVIGRGPTDHNAALVEASDSSTVSEAQDATRAATGARQAIAARGSASASAQRAGQSASARSEPPLVQAASPGQRGTADQAGRPRFEGQRTETAPGDAGMPSGTTTPNAQRADGAAGRQPGADLNGSRAASGAASAGDRGRGTAGAAAGGGPTIGKNASGGGVQDAQRQTGADPRRPTPAEARASLAEQYGVAAKAAESAVAQERIPDRLRGYVRDYFLAMRPASGREEAR